MTAEAPVLTDPVQKQLDSTGFGVTTQYRAETRLAPATRALAAQYLSGAVGRTIREADFGLDPACLAHNPTPNREVAEAIRTIAAHAPLRILPGEKLVGAATLRAAMAHVIPLTSHRSISHTTIDFDKAMRIGYRGLRAEIDDRLTRGGLDGNGVDLLESMRICIAAAGIWHGRYVARLEERIADSGGAENAHWKTVLDGARRVPEEPPATFREGVQALWLLWDFQRLCGNWSGIGRIDKMLGPLLERDRAVGRIDLDEARELLAHFWIKGCEWITAEGRGSGDAQFYQNIVLAGVDEAGRPVANAVTDLVLDVVEELHISDFPIAVRIDAHTPDRLLERIAAIQRLGGGTLAVYNDDRIIPNLVRFGYPLAEARNYANDGCWEILIPGKTAFGYQPFDTLLLLQETLGLTEAAPVARTEKPECSDLRSLVPGDGAGAAFPDFESLYADFRARLARTVDELLDCTPFSDQPCPLLSLLVEGCVETGRSYLDGGPLYTVRSPHAGGLPDVANALLAIRRLVYEEQAFTLPALIGILRDDWAGHEALRRRIRRQFGFYGNDDADADAMLKRVFEDYADLVGAERERHGVLRPAGISTFGREGSQYLPHRTASAAGTKRGDVLAGNFSPSPGTDRRGPTAVIRSHCAVDLRKLPCGTALDLKIAPGSVRGETGIRALAGLMRSFVRLGGIFLQIDVVDTDLLRDAQAHPEKYPNLAVRISGWSARFATLTREWQDMIIVRTEQNRDH